MIISYMNSYVYEFIYMNSYMNSYDFFIYEFICFMNSYMNSGVPRFQMSNSTTDLRFKAHAPTPEIAAPFIIRSSARRAGVSRHY